MSQFTKKNQANLSVTVTGVALSFTVGRDDYNWYINNITQNNKVAPSHNFLMRTVDGHCEADLKNILNDSPGSEVQIAGAVLEEYTPDLDIVVKKSSGSPTA